MWADMSQEKMQEISEKRKKNAVIIWSNLEFRVRFKVSIVEGWDNEKRREETADRTKKQWADPEIREKMSQALSAGQKKRWARQRRAWLRTEGRG